jgi:hypothetical protein
LPWVQKPDPSVLGQVVLQDARDLGLRSCPSQATWVRCTFRVSSFLGLEGDVGLQLIIIIIITITITIDFILKIKSIFFYSNNIYCKFNNINEFNNIYNIIIIFNLSVHVLIFFSFFSKKLWFFFDGNNNFFKKITNYDNNNNNNNINS